MTQQGPADEQGTGDAAREDAPGGEPCAEPAVTFSGGITLPRTGAGNAPEPSVL